MTGIALVDIGWDMVFCHPTFRLTLLLALGAALAPRPAAAQPKALKSAPEWDYSRFRDGPRRVPEPRGASLERAEALGLGTRRAANRLLTRRPKEGWRMAARGRVSDELAWPVPEGHFGRGFGHVRHRRPDLRHDGVDIVAEEGAVIRAVADGIVAYSDNGIRGFGNCLLIVHPNGWVSLYAHNFRNTVQAGWRVERGERIGFVGHTGIARGPHLHFELRVDGRPVDPTPKLAQVRRKGDPPLTEAAAAEAEEEAEARDGDADDDSSGQVLAGAHLGTVTTARRLMRQPASETLREATDAR
ncbi:MAG: M23 family metallopeptidase, partial [Polyangiales bacterium]